MCPELKTLEWWISGLMLNSLFFLISRLNIACSPLIFNLQINYPIRIKDIPFSSGWLWKRTDCTWTDTVWDEVLRVRHLLQPRNEWENCVIRAHLCCRENKGNWIYSTHLPNCSLNKVRKGTIVNWTSRSK